MPGGPQHTATYERCLQHLEAHGFDTAAAHRICYSVGAGGEGVVGAARESAVAVLEAAATKHEAGYDWPAHWFLYVPDAEMPSTWKLRFGELVNGDPQVTQPQLGAAAAALSAAGYRGQRVDVPESERGRLRGKLRGLYSAHGWNAPASLNESAAPSSTITEATATVSGERVLEGDVFEHALTEASVDEPTRTIKNVVLVGPDSPTRKRGYPASTLSDAKPLYEGARVYLDHPPEGKEADLRGVRDLAGRVVRGTVRLEEASGKLRADIKTNTTEAGQRLLTLAKDDPDLIGMSHNALGSERIVEGRATVEKIRQVRSVDVVTNPGTTKGLFESAKGDNHMADVNEKDVLKGATLQQIVTLNPGLVSEIQEAARTEVREKELKPVQTELATVKKDLAKERGTRIVESVLGKHTELPKSAADRVRVAMLALPDGTALTEGAVEQAITETTAFLESCGIKLTKPADSKGTQTPAPTPGKTPLLEGGGIPTGDHGGGTPGGDSKTLKESERATSAFSRMLGLREEAKAGK